MKRPLYLFSFFLSITIKFQMIWNILNESHVHQKLSKFLYRQWFGIYFIHSTLNGFLYIFVLYVASNGDDFWLLFFGNINIIVEFPDSYCGLVPVHEWHVAINQNQRVSIDIVFIYRFLDNFYCLFTIIGKLSHFFTIFKT